MLSENWLDAVIQSQVNNGAVAIAKAIAENPQFVAAINAGLRQPVEKFGPSTAQAIRQELGKLFCGT